MANEQNLRVPTPSEARINGSKGGKASAKKKKQMKTFRELCNEFAESKITDEKLVKKMVENGIADEEVSWKMAMVVAMARKATSGDTRAFEIYRDTSGEKPIEKVENVNPPVINIQRPKK